MIVRAAQKTLIANLFHSRAVLLKALPRAGRTSLSETLILDMGDGSALITGEECGCLQAQDILTTYAERTLFVDSIDSGHVKAIDALIRSCLKLGPSAPRFVLLGCDAKTEQLLSGALTGIVSDVKLPPIQVLEHFDDSMALQTAHSPTHAETPQAQATNMPAWDQEVLWLRGGLPESLYAEDDERSFAWRTSYLESILNQDFRYWNVDASDRLPDVFQWIANNNGVQFNDAKCASALSVKKESVRKSLDILKRMGLLRCLPNWPAGSNRSFNSMPVYYVKDCGLLHAMLGIDTIRKLRVSNAIGHSWESFASEALINAVQGRVTPAVYRDKDKNEIDLILDFAGGTVFAIEFKVSGNKQAKKGFSIGCNKIGNPRKLLVHAGENDTRFDDGVSRLSLISAIRSLPK